MGNSFLVYLLIAIIIPILLILFFAGPEVLSSAIQTLAIVFLAAFIFFMIAWLYLKRVINTINLNFENALVITSYLLKIIAIFNLILVIVAGFGVSMFKEDLINLFGANQALILSLLLALTLLTIAVPLSIVASYQLTRLSKIGYFLALVVSLPYVFLIVGVFPLWFLLKFKSVYFTK